MSNDRIFPGLSAYSAAKEAVRAFAKVLAAEMLPRNIRVNAVAPGFILTPSMGVAELTEQQRAECIRDVKETTPMGRPSTVDEVASAALYLADATFTTGTELIVDGGFAPARLTPLAVGRMSSAPQRSFVGCTGEAMGSRYLTTRPMSLWLPAGRSS